MKLCSRKQKQTPWPLVRKRNIPTEHAPENRNNNKNNNILNGRLEKIFTNPKLYIPSQIRHIFLKAFAVLCAIIIAEATAVAGLHARVFRRVMVIH
jgi:hypothetical protein